MSEPQDQIVFGHYVVALVDFVGQSRELANWDFLPDSPGDTARFVAAAKNTYGRIIAWRNRFEEMFKLWLSAHRPPTWVEEERDGGEGLRQFQDVSIEFSHFSDTIVVFSLLQNAYDHLGLQGTCAFIYTCGCLMLDGLAKGVVFRGAIEVGMATRCPQADLYGPALAKANHLESKVADYPRIVIGSELCDYILLHAGNTEPTPPARTNRWLAEFCQRLLTRDSGGCWIVDYMGEGFGGKGTNQEAWRGLQLEAFDLVRAERARFREAKEERLAERYEKLTAYFQSRGLPPSGEDPGGQSSET